jgi:subtilisin family serine protease
VSPPGHPDVLILRNYVNITFDDTTSGVTVRRIFAKYGAEVVGGHQTTGAYIIRIPDPGPTWAAVDSVIALMDAEPGVRAAYRRVKYEPGHELGRYPNDGPVMQRAHWLGSATAGTRGLRAIRAPLAWGCETGLYAPGTVGVGVVDDVFDIAQADFAELSKHVDTVDAKWFAARPITYPYSLSHGTGVVGVITALGDNGTGTAGLVWASSLRLFRLAREVNGVTREVEDRGDYLTHEVLPAARSADIRILHSSITAAADPRLARELSYQLQQFVNAPGGRLFVQSAGNDRVEFSATQADSLPPGGFLVQQAVVSLRGTPAANRIILVGAADADGDSIWVVSDNPMRGTTLWTGVTDILAPSESVLVLARPQDFAAGTTVVDGSSFGAPMVTGVATQLWESDPTLTPERVKDYILRGALEPRLDSLGRLGTPDPIPGSGGLHLLDAYGALSLLSRERPGTTPICGGQVWARETSIYVDQGAFELRVIPVAGDHFLGLASVAQGGRRIAVTDFRFPDPTETLIVTNTGAIDSVLSGVYARQYLERGTADLKTASPDGSFAEGLMVTLRGTGVDLTDQRLDGVTAPPGPARARRSTSSSRRWVTWPPSKRTRGCPMAAAPTGGTSSG